MSRVIAILCSDIHLSHKVPVARSAEPDWYAAMQRPLDELRQLAGKHRAPIICAGDIFDRWNSPPELINFAIENLPQVYAVPGQHDLANHSLELINRSAYYTLMKADKVHNLYVDSPKIINQESLLLYGFPWGEAVKPPLVRGPHPIVGFPESAIHLAVVHAYIWRTGSSYPGASPDAKIGKWKEKLKGYDCAVFGDNHKGFMASINGGCTDLINCGGFMRRKIDEVDSKPQVGILYEDGVIEPHYLDVSLDKFIDPDDMPLSAIIVEAAEFLEELKALGNDSLDFREAINRYINDHELEDATKQFIREAIEE